MNCPCGSNETYAECCEPIISGKQNAPTAEKLMRARYSAYTRGEIGFITDTLAPESRKGFDPKAAKKWATDSQWKGLKIMSTDKGSSTDKKGTVEFTATYTVDGETLDHHEVATFRKTDKGEWLFVDGDSHVHKEGEGHHHHHAKPQTVVRDAPKVGRNDPCPCGSEKKFKKCCGAAA